MKTLNTYNTTRTLLFSIAITWAIMTPTFATAATEEEIAIAATDGISWLASQQNDDGSWGSSNIVAETCFTLLKLEDWACSEGFENPFDSDYQYSDEIIMGWEYVFNPTRTLKQQPLPTQDHTGGASGTVDDPDTNGNGYGIFFGGSASYTAGICLMALTHAREKDYLGNECRVQMPLDRPNEIGTDFNGDAIPDTYGEIAQDVGDWLAFAQGDSGWPEGGWTYGAQSNAGSRADQSVSGYAVMGLAALEARGLTVPSWVKTELNTWINYIQCADGGASYAGCGVSSQLRTGNLIFQMTFVGDSTSAARFESALQYIENHWRDVNLNPGWGYSVEPAEYQAMYTLMKGLAYSRVRLIDTDGDGVRDNDWYNQEPFTSPAQDFASLLVAQQNADGSWPSNCRFGDVNLCTVWPWLTLKAVIPLPPARCSMLGEDKVKIGYGSSLHEGSQKPNVCSNGKLMTGSHVKIMDEGTLQSNGNMWLGKGTKVSANALSNGNLKLLPKTEIQGNAEAAGNLVLYNKSIVHGECVYGDNIEFRCHSNSCGLEIFDPDNQPYASVELPECAVTAPGGDWIKTRWGKTYGLLPPGDYGKVNFGYRNRVELCGDYTFKKLHFGPRTEVEISCPTTLQVKGELVFDKGVKEILTNGTKAENVIYLIGSKLFAYSDRHIGKASSELYGTVCGPNALVYLGNGTAFTGGIYAKQIVLGARVSFTAASTTSLP